MSVTTPTAAYKKTKKQIRNGLNEVDLPNPEEDDDPYAIVWQISGDRSIAIVPNWVAMRIKFICEGDKALDFQIEAMGSSEPPAAEAA